MTLRPSEETPTDQLVVSDVAALAGITRRTIYRYHSQGYMPPADGHHGPNPWWHRHTINAWLNQRKPRRTPTRSDQ